MGSPAIVVRHWGPVDKEQLDARLLAAKKLLRALDRPSCKRGASDDWEEQLQPSSRAAVDAGDATGPSRLAGLEDFVCFTKSQSVSLPSGPSSIRTDSGASGGARSESEEQLSRGGADRSEENVEMSSVGTYQTLPQRRRAIRPNASSAPRTSALKHVSTLSDVTASSVEEVEVDPGIGALERCIWPTRLPPLTSSLPALPLPKRRPPKIHRSFVVSAADSLVSGRGSWLVPVNGRFSVEGASGASWKHGTASGSEEEQGSDIRWTCSRLKALWTLVTEMQRAGKLGEVDAHCIFADVYSSRSDPLELPDHIRICVDAPLALTIRALLGLTKACTLAPDEGDSVPFLGKGSGVSLVWMDAVGSVVLLA